jgi:hypothetical protein
VSRVKAVFHIASSENSKSDSSEDLTDPQEDLREDSPSEENSEDSEKDSKGDSKDNINENDKNYIMNKIPVPKNRFGGVQKGVFPTVLPGSPRSPAT